MTRTIETPVLIVGAGPIGLGLALDLGMRGTECTLIELTDGVIVQPKIGLMAVRTMEIFRRWGIADEVKARIVVPPPGTPVGALVANGQASLGFQQ